MRAGAGSRVGLLGRILAILLLTVAIEFGASTLLYERASRFLLQEDEAHRLAEHLLVTRKLLSDQPRGERPALARLISSERYQVRWEPMSERHRLIAPELPQMTRQVIAWEPALADGTLSLRLVGGGPDITGSLRMEDGSWLQFGAHETAESWDLALHRILLGLVPAMALLAIGGLMIRATLRPLRVLAHATDRIGYGNPVHLDEAGTAEVRRLIRAYNAMQERIHGLVEDRTQALAAVGHDLRTPIARLRLRAEAVDPLDLRAEMQGDLDEVEAMLASLQAFLSGESDPERPSRADLAVMASTIAQDFEDRGYRASYGGPEHHEVTVRIGDMRRAIVNLVENAIVYGDMAEVTLVTRPDAIVLAVEDEGPGIPPDKLGIVTHPFVRLDEARGRNTRGLGLGLAIVARAVEREGGTFVLSNRSTGGLRAEIRLPLYR